MGTTIPKKAEKEMRKTMLRTVIAINHLMER